FISKEAEMGRCIVTGWAFAALLAASGCAASKTIGPIGAAHSVDDPQSQLTAVKRNPFRRAPKAASALPKSAKQVEPTDDAGRSRGKKQLDSTAKIDAETMRLLEEELRHEPPAERERLKAQWTKFDSVFIRQLVESHRMARETAEKRIKQSIEQASADDEPSEGSIPDSLDRKGETQSASQKSKNSLGSTSPGGAAETAAATA